MCSRSKCTLHCKLWRVDMTDVREGALSVWKIVAAGTQRHWSRSRENAGASYARRLTAISVSNRRYSELMAAVRPKVSRRAAGCQWRRMIESRRDAVTLLRLRQLRVKGKSTRRTLSADHVRGPVPKEAVATTTHGSSGPSKARTVCSLSPLMDGNASRAAMWPGGIAGEPPSGGKG